MPITYFVHANGSRSFKHFTKQSEAMAYARKCVADGCEGVTVQRLIPGRNIETIKIYN